jgi:hypothetical protein
MIISHLDTYTNLTESSSSAVSIATGYRLDDQAVPSPDKKKSKAIPITDLGGLQGCEILRIPHCLDNRLTDGGKVVSSMLLPHLHSPET